MTVTDTRQGKRGLIYVFIDGEYAFSAYPDILHDFSIYEGSAVDAALLERVLDKQNELYAKRRAIGILSAADCSEKALYTKLVARGIQEKHAADAVAYSKEQGFIDDGRYIAQLAAYLFETKMYGARRVREYLICKGFERDMIDGVLDSYGQDPVPIIIERLKRLAPEELADKKKAGKIVEQLLRKGFVYSDIRTAIAQYASLELEPSED